MLQRDISMTSSPTKLFGTDGIRAEVGLWPLIPEFVYQLGVVAGDVLKISERRNTFVIGRDTRASSPMLQNALTAGLLTTGATVIDAGVITTPGVAYLAHTLDAAAGIVISASHNPVKENGIKFFTREGLKLAETIEAEIEHRLSNATGTWAFRQVGRTVDGQALSHELYVDHLLAEHQDLSLNSLTIVVDCANGAASWPGPECLARLGARIIVIHASPTGLNINDRAGSEYVRRQPEELGRLVQEYRADFGLALDGDADRVVFVDERSQLIDGDHMLAIIAQYLDDRQRLFARSIVTTSMRNEGLVRFIKSHLEQVYETPVGDKYVVQKLLDLTRELPSSDKVALGGEQAGHIVLMDENHRTGDGIRTALFVIRAFLESKANSFSELKRIIQKTPQVIASAYVGNGLRLNRDALSALESQLLCDIPLLKRVNLRYSGTEPLFRAMLEANDTLAEIDLGKVAWEVCRRIQSTAHTHDGFIEILNCSSGGLLGPFSQTGLT